MRTREITTKYVYDKPERIWLWWAWFKGEEKDESAPFGCGETEAEAIKNLQDKISDKAGQ